ncbi:MAG: TolC family protein, partial [Thermoanaerobaculia bacterium]
MLAAALAVLAPAAARSQTPTTPATPAVSTSVAGTPVSLDDAVKMAEAQSEAVGIARAGVMRTEGQKLQARSQYFPQVAASGGYTRTLKSQYSGFGGTADTTTTTKVVSPAPPCDAYLKDATASVADRLFGLEQSSRCSLGQNPFSAFSSLPFGQANQYNLGLSVSQNLFTGGRTTA